MERERKKNVRFYKSAFQLMEPYHMLLEPRFLKDIARVKILLPEQVVSIFKGRIMPSECSKGK